LAWSHSQGDSVADLEANMREVIAMLLDERQPELASEPIGLRRIRP
jgi:predicted RNase H-like HicB family nuclease